MVRFWVAVLRFASGVSVGAEGIDAFALRLRFAISLLDTCDGCAARNGPGFGGRGGAVCTG